MIDNLGATGYNIILDTVRKRTTHAGLAESLLAYNLDPGVMTDTLTLTLNPPPTHPSQLARYGPGAGSYTGSPIGGGV